MIDSLADILRHAVGMLIVLTLLTGLIYPLVVTGMAQVLFPQQANGSLIATDGKAGGLGADRPAVRRSEVLLVAAVGHLRRCARTTRRPPAARTWARLNPALARGGQGQRSRRCGRPIRASTAQRAGRPGHRLAPAGSTRTSARPPREYQVRRVAPARDVAEAAGAAPGGAAHRGRGNWASWASRG